MDFLVNDLSLDGQFPDINSFRYSIQRVIEIRNIALRFGRSLYCNRNILHARITKDMVMQQAVQSLPKNERRALMTWITQHGPFWEDIRTHGPDDYIEHKDRVVTDSAVGEAAWYCLHGINRELVSFIPSDWKFSPVHVDWVLDNANKKTVAVVNQWDPSIFEDALLSAPVPINAWRQLEEIAKARFIQLTFAEDAFVHLNGHPFVDSAAERIIIILEILNRLKLCFDANGQRTPEGHELYQLYFTGKKGDGGRGALFTDSSDSEKDKFGNEMTFGHPEDPKKSLMCPWHGKIQTPQFRVHFSFPIRADKPLYVVYIGPKITKR